MSNGKKKTDKDLGIEKQVNIAGGGQRIICIRKNIREKVIINSFYYDSVFQIIKTAVPPWQAHIKTQPRDNDSVNRHETEDKVKEHNESPERSS